MSRNANELLMLTSDNAQNYSPTGFFSVDGQLVSCAWEVLGLYRTREWAGCPHEHGGIARVRYSDLKEAARFAADAGVMEIQLRKSRFGGVPGRRGKAQHPTRRKEELLTAQMWCRRDGL